jgi:hypothetical protein
MTGDDKTSEHANHEGDSEPTRPDCLAPLDFSTFIMSLGSSALVNLGRIAAPGGPKMDVDLKAAKQIIDILAVLEEKTKGNLNESEEKLIRSLLYDLRVQYVDAQKS